MLPETASAVETLIVGTPTGVTRTAMHVGLELAVAAVGFASYLYSTLTFYYRGRVEALAVGCALLIAATLDVLHGVLSALPTLSRSPFVPASFAIASGTLLVSLIGARYLARRYAVLPRSTLLAAAVGIYAASVAGIVGVAILPIEQAWTAYFAAVPRFFDTVLFAAWGTYGALLLAEFVRHRADQKTRFLLIFLAIGSILRMTAHVLIGYAGLYEPAFFVAHGVKLVSSLCFFIGIVLDDHVHGELAKAAESIRSIRREIQSLRTNGA